MLGTNLEGGCKGICQYSPKFVPNNIVYQVGGSYIGRHGLVVSFLSENTMVGARCAVGVAQIVIGSGAGTQWTP